MSARQPLLPTAGVRTDRSGGCLIFALSENGRVNREQAHGRGRPGVSDADLDLLDMYLLSDQSPPECMLLSDLDGFLTGRDWPRGGDAERMATSGLGWRRAGVR